MKNNVFQFSDKYFLQLTGTAMGTPPAPSYANLYFGIKEMQLARFNGRCPFRKRYIDDVFGVWIMDDNKDIDDAAWKEFQDEMNDFGDLRWEFSERTRSVSFLDLNIAIDTSGQLSTTIFEKMMNLYLYIPQPHATHLELSKE